MPVLDFSSDSTLPSTKGSFWLYWAVSIPLTVVVMVCYIAYQWYLERKHRREDARPAHPSVGSPKEHGYLRYDESEMHASPLVSAYPRLSRRTFRAATLRAATGGQM